MYTKHIKLREKTCFLSHSPVCIYIPEYNDTYICKWKLSLNLQGPFRE